MASQTQSGWSGSWDKCREFGLVTSLWRSNYAVRIVTDIGGRQRTVSWMKITPAGREAIAEYSRWCYSSIGPGRTRRLCPGCWLQLHHGAGAWVMPSPTRATTLGKGWLGHRSITSTAVERFESSSSARVVKMSPINGQLLQLSAGSANWPASAEGKGCGPGLELSPHRPGRCLSMT